MTKQEIIVFYKGLNKNKNIGGVKFKYAVNKNINILTSEIEALNKTISFSEDFIKFDNERVELAKKNAKKDENGKEIITKTLENGQLAEKYVMEDDKKFEKEFDKLKKEYKEAIENREKQIKDYQELLKEIVIPLNLHFVKLSDVPDNVVDMGDIMIMIDGSESNGKS